MQQRFPAVQSSEPSQLNLNSVDESQFAEHCAAPVAVVTQQTCPGKRQVVLPQ
jgi:hypothetical protein